MERKSIEKILIVILAAVIVVAVVYFLSREELDYFPGVENREEITPPPATGKIVDLENTLLKEIADGEFLLEEEDKDALLIISDDDEINDFGQSVDEKDLY